MSDFAPDGVNNYTGDNVVIELEIPDGDVLLSDEENWHYVLNNWYLHDVNDDTDKWDETEKWFDNLSHDEQDSEKRKSWERIFDKDDGDNDWKFVQATFWELRAGQIKSVRKFTGRGRKASAFLQKKFTIKNHAHPCRRVVRILSIDQFLPENALIPRAFQGVPKS